MILFHHLTLLSLAVWATPSRSACKACSFKCICYLNMWGYGSLLSQVSRKSCLRILAFVLIVLITVIYVLRIKKTYSQQLSVISSGLSHVGIYQFHFCQIHAIVVGLENFLELMGKNVSIWRGLHDISRK